jgi:hypothetical protein
MKRMPSKPTVTKTLGPLHFEDLDPHRFEDLIRELAYDFRDWISIEATGRSGTDDGFDIRAFERSRDSALMVDEPNEDEDAVHPMDGRVWMFQCKRERTVGPKKIQSIIEDGVSALEPPYGYVLAAPANFSKAAYDKFREELRSRGVMEFYLWGRADLEDMLHLPKNDRILFAFFGISLITRRKSRAAELRALISVKNKLQKLIGIHPNHDPVLLRDSKDTFYPYEGEYDDFGSRPRWIEKHVVQMHPLGLIFEAGRYFAICDLEAKTWDYTDAINQARSSSDHYDNQDEHQLRQRIQAFVESFPRRQHATLVEHRIVRFEAIVAIDDEGDAVKEMPHIYVDFDAANGPFSGVQRFISFSQHHSESLEELNRISIFPAEFQEPVLRLIQDRKLSLQSSVSDGIRMGRSENFSLYDCDGTMDFLRVGDVIALDGVNEINGAQLYIKITHQRSENGAKIISRKSSSPMEISSIQSQLGRTLSPEDIVQILEFKRLSNWELRELEGSQR